MTLDQQHNPDPNESAARIVAGSEARDVSKAPNDLEAGWRDWSSRFQKVDDRALPLLKAAFEAGFDAGRLAGH